MENKSAISIHTPFLLQNLFLQIFIKFRILMKVHLTTIKLSQNTH